ncbi:retrovirus-related Pol polyprotein from transposon 412 [Trichonephila clavipes]|nr:retrovirus-related Pol polyprotein from transposon 412 [Trichonephila clavipes]
MAYFTKWPEAYPISDQEALTVAEVLVQHWISRFGVPLQLHSDQRRNFDSCFARDCMKHSPSTTALHPQSEGNGREVQSDHPEQPLSLGIQSSAQPFIRCTLGDEEYIEKLQSRMEEMHHLARERISMASEKMKSRYDARATGHNFPEGDKEWLWNPKHRKGLSPKMQTNWKGPYTVLKRLNEVAVQIQKSPHSKPKVARPSRRERLGAERDRGRDQHGGAIGHETMSGIVGDDLNKMVLT